jgi:succinoglycan biosynthesis transport protein ExoP
MLDRPMDNAGTAFGPDPGTPRPGQQRASPRESLSGLLSAVRQRRMTLVASIVLIPLCTWLTLQQITPLYTASGSLIYDPSEFKVRELQSILRTDPTTEAMMSSQAEILHSLHIAQRVAERGHLFQDPEFNVALRPPGLVHRMVTTLRWLLGMETETAPEEPVYGPQPDRTRDRTLLAVQDALHAAAVRLSHVVEVTFVADDPVVAAAAVNNAMDTYIKDQYAAKHRAVDNANNLLEKQATELRRQVRQAEERMSTYRSDHALSQGMHAGTDLEEISHLTEDLVKAMSERATANARLDAARGKAGAEAQAAVAPSVAALRAQQEQLSGQLKAQQARLGSAHPEAQSLIRQYADGQRALNAEIGRFVAATDADQHAAAERVTSLETILAKAKTAAEGSARAEIPLNAMNRDLEAARGQLQAVLERMQQTTQQSAVESSEAHEISEAIPPDRPTYPRTTQTMAASLAAAVFLGLLLIYILQLTDGTLHSGEEIRLLTGLPCLALIPEVGRRALGHLKIQDYVVRRPLTAFAEQVRSLRVGVSLDVEHPQIITVSGIGPADGKSLLTVALGRSAALDGERVLAIECDVRQATFQHRLNGGFHTGSQVRTWSVLRPLMRAPPIHPPHIQPPPVPGLLDVLRGEAEWTDAVQTDQITDMKFITAGKPGSDVLGLFLSDAMRRLLEEAREHYDLILLDTPPIEAMTETRVAAALADATLVCVRWRSTTTKSLLHALEALRDAHATVIGTVLTRVDPRVHLRSGHADAAVYHRRYKAYFRG